MNFRVDLRRKQMQQANEMAGSERERGEEVKERERDREKIVERRGGG